MGYFYPPPPLFIGGKQPYAPPLGIVQSGPVPQAPPQRGPIALATLGVLISSWQPPFQQAQGASDIAPIIQTPAAPSQPPAPRNAALFNILGAWQQDPITIVSLPSAAGNVGVTPDQPQPVGRVNFDIIRRSWDIQFQLIGPARIAPLAPAPAIPDQPPIPSRNDLYTILRAWAAPFQYPQGAGHSAPTLPAPAVPSQPPITSYAIFYRLRGTWEQPFQMPAGAGNSAPNLPVGGGGGGDTGGDGTWWLDFSIRLPV